LPARRHSILKEGLTAGGRNLVCASLALPDNGRNHTEIPLPVAYSRDDSASASNSTDISFMTLLATAQHIARDTRKDPRSHMILIMAAATVAVGAIGLVAYLLWPTWGNGAANAPSRLPVSVGGTLFNVPTPAIRRKIQRHSGPQERVDLSFTFPSLEPPEAPKHVSADTVEEKVQPIDRIFLSISAHHDTLAPDTRLRTIYPRYLEQVATPVDDGLTMRAFRDGSPYANEDLFVAGASSLNARCTRDGVTPGMCLSERRIDGADLTFRFPRSWLSQWRDVANAIDRLTAQLRGPKG
jgi:hypothetical protein